MHVLHTTSSNTLLSKTPPRDFALQRTPCKYACFAHTKLHNLVKHHRGRLPHSEHVNKYSCFAQTKFQKHGAMYVLRTKTHKSMILCMFGAEKHQKHCNMHVFVINKANSMVICMFGAENLVTSQNPGLRVTPTRQPTVLWMEPGNRKNVNK